MTVTPLYAALLTFLYLFLSFRVIRGRWIAKVAIGDGGDRMLERRIRVHANFAEYVPLALMLMLLAELQDAPSSWLHAIGGMLLAGRMIHAFGVSRSPETLPFRSSGMALTFTALASGAVLNAWMWLV